MRMIGRLRELLHRNQDFVWIVGGFMTVMAALAYQDVTVVLTWAVTLSLVAWRVTVRVTVDKRGVALPDPGTVDTASSGGRRR